MILQKEISTIAEASGVAKFTIDKDWALGHFIDAIYSIKQCRDNLIFKGGTCLKKCYFPDYRFSEDLDFTATDPNFKLDKKLLNQITGLITERTEMPLHIQELKELRYKDQLTGYAAQIKFWGADHPRNHTPPPPERWQTYIKIEIILYEEMIFSPVQKSVHHGYSDSLSEAANAIPCYTLQEVMAEKLRALIQRSYTAPRDFYDIWYLSQNEGELDWKEISDAFHRKMKFKGLEFKGVDQLINDDNDKQLLAAWKNSLAHQIPGELPDYVEIKEGLKSLLNSNLSK
ncbi:MAG TPA: nucleotidyl transferase AbiEii/AbiGii toxin family protein [Fulvivirga sp.]|nr:nucleotidyl transferase AbiEii/AbiGii toxin family protein [Fulvivirga sp.]